MRRGTSLIEVLVAGIAMVALVIPLLVVFSSTLRTTEVSLQELHAQHLAGELVDQVRLVPWTVGFEWCFDRPFPNPPPEYPNFLPLAPGGPFPVAGLELPAAPGWALSREEELPTTGWTATGGALFFDTGTPPDPLVAERSRLFLSPAPEGFRRYLQVYRPIRGLNPLQTEADVFKIVVKVEWPSARAASGQHLASLTMRALTSNPRPR